MKQSSSRYLLLLRKILVGCLLSAVAFAATPQTGPQPNALWHFAPARVQPGSMNASVIEGGDVVLRWTELAADGGPSVDRGIAFLSAEEVMVDRREGLAFRFADGRVARAIGGPLARIDAGAGLTIEVEASSYRDCWRGPDDVMFVKRGRPGEYIWRKAAFIPLATPQYSARA